jgi:CBS domain-containing protein
MTENVFTLREHDDLAAMYDLMDSGRIRHVPIVDRDGDLVGLVTHRDLTRMALGPQDDLPLSTQRDILHRRKIREIMSTEVETVEPSTSLKDAAALLLEEKIGCLPVVEGSHVVGILTEADFARRFLERG